MKWVNRIGQGRIFLAVAALVIAVASLVVSHRLTKDLESEEHNKMEVWAEAMRTLNVADDDTDLTLVLKVIDENHTIPVIVLNPMGGVQTFRNLAVPHDAYPDSMHYVAAIGQRLLHEGKFIRIQLSDTISTDYIDVCYDDSTTLKRLAAYPLVQLAVVLIFVIVAIFALLISKRAEQNKVWVGLTKETAHQLGTPISSLMAWAQILHETYPDDPLIPEMEKDVQRLQLVADRFSKIGSLPELVPTSLGTVIGHVMAYMDRRTSHNVQIVSEGEAQSLIVRLNASLFEWVIENLCKNAVDAMGGEAGTITLRVGEIGQRVFVEVEDTGKGIRKKDLSAVFRPGFTTKKRGWGLGLSLAKRIVEEYHHGRIFVKWSEVGRGTIFRIELKK